MSSESPELPATSTQPTGDKLIIAQQDTAPTLPVGPNTPLPRDSSSQIGPYTILGHLGEGGMGTVYKAEQRHPLRRTVAVKVIKLGFDSREVIARFESERQALARMDHPNIAKVLDAGTDERGRPYFVMEYVPGSPITKYADDNRLTIQQRLELMLQVCDAIGHAHAKAIIHRDIKAGNVLAYTTPEGPRVKVIDFGVAKALTSDRLTDRTFNTASGHAIGTYESMSPEQADGSPDIDTRTDVYSLGVLLYELLSGSKPFDKSNLAKAANEEIRRIIREDEPPRPSTQLSSMGDNATKVAQARQIEVEALTGQLKSELDWIPLMALRKQRERRYATPQQMGEDIQRYIDGKPLIAAPDSIGYRIRKLAKRNKGPIVAITAVFLALVVGFGVASYGLIREGSARRAAQASYETEQQARNQLALEQTNTQKALLESEKHRIEAEQQGYSASISAAANAVEDHQMGLARQWLDGTAPSLRRWEWNYLRGRTDGSLAVLPRDGVVFDISFSPDGSRLVSVSGRTVNVWDTATGKMVVAFTGHRGQVISARFSPDGKQVLTASEDGTAQLWNSSSGDLVIAPFVHEKAVSDAEFRPDGRRIVTASMDGTARIWDWASRRQIIAIHVSQWPRSATFSPDGTRVLTTSFKDENGPTLWDATSNRQPVHFSGVTFGTHWDSAKFNSDGTRILLGGHNFGWCVWDLDSDLQLTPKSSDLELALSRGSEASFSPNGKCVLTINRGGSITGWAVRDLASDKVVAHFDTATDLIETASFSHDGTKIISTCNDQTARVYDARSGEEIAVLRGHSGSIRSAIFSPDGSRVATASEDGTIRLWDATFERDISVFRGEKSTVSAAAVSTDGCRVVVAFVDGTVSVVDTCSGRVTAELHGHKNQIQSVAFSSDMSQVLTSSLDNTARIWDVRSGHELMILRPDSGEAVTSATFSMDGTRILTTSFFGNTCIWDATSGKELFDLPATEGAPSVAVFSRSGKQILNASGGGKPASLWDATSGKEIFQLGHDLTTYSFARFSPDGSHALTIPMYGSGLHVWDTVSGNELFTIGGHSECIITNAKFSPDGTKLATIDMGHAARIWDVSSRRQLAIMLGHEAEVKALTYSPDGTMLATASEDKTARLWDVASGRQLIVFRGHTGAVRTVAFSVDGTRILTTSDDGTARIWDSVSAADRYKATGFPLVPRFVPSTQAATAPSVQN